MALGARWFDDEGAAAAIRDACPDRAHDAVDLAGHAAVALALGLAVGRVETATPAADGRSSWRGRVRLAATAAVEPRMDADATTRRLQACAAGPVAAELFCGAGGDHTDTFAFLDALEVWMADGIAPPEDEDATDFFAARLWGEARLAALALLVRPPLRRATLAIAARLLAPAAVVPGETVAAVYAEALRASGRPAAAQARRRGRRGGGGR